jgi:hypothetical protein
MEQRNGGQSVFFSDGENTGAKVRNPNLSWALDLTKMLGL